MQSVDISLFEYIAEDLSKKGYDVYSNVVGKQAPLSHTKELRCSIYEFYAICNHIDGVISVRSGILDLAVNTKAPFLVFNFPFPGKSKKYNEEWMARYALKAWGRENLMESLVYDREDAIRDYEKFKLKFLSCEVP